MSWRHVRVTDRDLWILFGALLIAGALWAFAELTDEVLEGTTHAFDRAVLLALRVTGDPGTPIGPGWLQEAASDITSLGSATVLSLMTIAAAGFLLLVGKPRAAVGLTVAVVGGGLLSSALKAGLDRHRPDVVLHLVQVRSGSFPSGHAMLATITYLTLGVMLARVQPKSRVRVYLLSWAVLLSLLVGASRVYLGVHWPTDVLAGWCLGAAWALLCALVGLWLEHRAVIQGVQKWRRPRPGLKT